MSERGCSFMLGLLLTVAGLGLAVLYFEYVAPRNWDGVAAIPVAITALGVPLIFHAIRKDDA